MQWFVSGDATLEANQSLRVQPTNHARQLFGHRGNLLATAFDETIPPRAEVRRDTEYTEVLHQILIDHHFVPVGQGLDSQVLCYTFYPIPDGYHLIYAQSRQLWKRWWRHPSRLTDRHLQLDLFVLADHQWYPVRSIAVNSGTIYVETLRGETVHHGDDLMVWLEKDACDEGDRTCVWAPPAIKNVPAASTQPSPSPADKPVVVPPVVVPPVVAPPVVVPPVVAPTQPPTPDDHQVTVDPALAPVVYALDGRVYVRTAVGLIVVEGEHLKAYCPDAGRAAVRRQVSQRHPSR